MSMHDRLKRAVVCFRRNNPQHCKPITATCIVSNSSQKTFLNTKASFRRPRWCVHAWQHERCTDGLVTAQLLASLQPSLCQNFLNFRYSILTPSPAFYPGQLVKLVKWAGIPRFYHIQKLGILNTESRRPGNLRYIITELVPPSFPSSTEKH